MREYPHLVQLYEKYNTQGFTVVAVSKQDPAVVKEFVQKEKPPFPFTLDPGGKVAAEYGAKGTPNSYLVDTEGQVVTHVSGFKPEEFENRIVKEIPRLLENGAARQVSALPK